MTNNENEELLENLEADVSKRVRTPQEKKALSYAKDRRNAYGQNDKNSQKSIRRNKTNPTRAHRRNAEQLIQSQIKVSETGDLDLMESKVRALKRRKWKKSPDMPLGDWVKNRFEYRRRMFRARIERQSRMKED